ncbi:ABC transporter A family member 1 isoform X1 [Typha angustifolia]|uniref:ABC transporter A family member 1 isoform X1 n=2 Tax=Typha angustifolia TaxID=59011 RepID=UPI003C3049FD
MGESRRQLRAMLRKNWLLKIRHPLATCTEILLPTIVMLMLIVIRTRVDTQIHPVQAYIRKGMFVEVGRSEISPSFDSILKLMFAKGESLAFAPNTYETRLMLDVLAMKYPLLKMVGRIYEDELDFETYIRSDLYGINDHARNLSNPQIRGAVIFHEQGPQVFDYSIRLNHTWAFSGFPDVKTIMDVNGPYLNDLELGMNIVPTLQYGFSGFLTLQQVVDSLVVLFAQRIQANITSGSVPLSIPSAIQSDINLSWIQSIPAKIRIAPFPTREYTDDEFQSIVKTVMGVLYLLGFLYPISRLISYSVSEKEQKIKEGLHMMGLKDEIFYLSWFITYSLQFAISSAIITACTMSSLFLYSDKSLVFVYFFLFGVSAVMLSFFISTFFSRAKTAAAVGTLSFLGAFFPYYSVNDPAVPMIWKILASLLSPTAFALGTVNFADYERAHVGVRWTNMWQESSGVNFFVCLMMMMVDSALYCSFGLYLDKVLPREYGVRYPWNFLFTRLFWQRRKTFHYYADNQQYKLNDELLNGEKQHTSKGLSEPAIEAVSLDMKQQELDGRCIHIRNLRKVYTTKKGQCCALNSLQLTLYENQILALLGHNGAGKSTTISLLVGLLPPTSGDAVIFGKSIRTDMDEIRKTLGVCPQNDILFAELTVKEHMEIFAILKGVEEDCLDREVIEMIDEVGLADKTNTLVGSLSGGMKRKLSLGIALIGNSKVIILDEPTSGMDPYSMRSTWQLIKKIKKGRIILLTTHSMDEADVLGDRIAIMANGHLRCCGSSLFLKHKYGVGYTLTIVKSAPSASMATQIVHRHVPTATCLSDVGTEISFRLPLSSSSSFESMFREIESFIKRPGMEIENQSLYSESFFGIESYGISVTTLEEVFLRVTAQNFGENDKGESLVSHTGSDFLVSEASNCSLIEPSHAKPCVGIPTKLFRWICCTLVRGCSLVFEAVCSFIALVTIMFCCCDMLTSTTFWKHSKALFIKRAISARRDRRTIIFQLFIPAVFLLFGLLSLKLKPHPDQSSVMLTTSYFNPLLRGGGGGGPIPFNLSQSIAEQVATNVRGGWIQKQEPRAFKFPDPEKALADAIDAAGPNLGPALLSMSEFLITSLNESYQSRYGAVVMDDQDGYGSIGYTILHNSSCQHAAPTYINLVNAAILRIATNDKNMTIRTRNHPLPMTMSQRSQRHDLDAFSASIIVAIAFSFIPASFAVAIVKEREVKAKHQQLISGVSIFSYWISTYIWDFISFLFPASLAMALFFIFGLNQFVGNGSFLPTIVIFLEYGMAIASSTYCLTFFFSDHSVAQNVVLLVHFFSGLILMVISFLMGLIEATKSVNSLLKIFFRLSPGFCFADGLASLALRHQDMKRGIGSGILDWNVTGASICYLAAESVIYFLLTIGLELFPYEKPNLTSIREWWQHFISVKHGKSGRYFEPLIASPDDTSVSLSDEDEDVRSERQRIVGGFVDNAIIYLRNLQKVYPARRNHAAKIAVHSLTFSVQEGECFGFLGTNGAGKTTTLSMLTGEESPSDGTAYIFGCDIRLQPKAVRQHIGYCPQFDALLEFLTAREHLELYARIKGVSEISMNDIVNQKLLEFDLWKHADKPSYSLSGGNKRKLSVAIAMIGNPPIVILDEPSTGMDPIAKRFMWDVISRLSTRRGKTAIILTTHSMNEAQALCTRIGIMVGGRLRCIGSPQHLKTRFGNYLELEVKPTEVSSVELDALCREIQETLLYSHSNSRNLLRDLEVCIGGSGKLSLDAVSEISLTREMIILVARTLGNEESIQTITCSIPGADGVFGEQLSEQLIRDGGVPLRIFAEWWLAKQKFLLIDSFVLTSFPGATFHGCNGLSVKYQLPYGDDSSLADIFGHLEHNRKKLGIEDYSISQSTLETIFNHFAATH